MVDGSAMPSGAVTFLFTDIEGSTARWEADPEGMDAALAAHDEVLVGMIGARQGRVFNHRGDGVAAAFSSPSGAVRAAVAVQREVSLPVRMGLVTGEATWRDGNYFGTVLNQTARVTDAGHGGQILVAASTASLVGDLEGVELVDLGEHRLRDLSQAIRLFQVRADGLGSDFPPLRTLTAGRHNLPVVHSKLVGRDELVDTVAEQVCNARVVTLTGFGGVGKTRLALATAGELVERFPAGVFFAALQPLDSADGVVPAVASAVGMRLSGVGADPSRLPSAVAQFVAARDMLVVLDNCEHVLDAAADLVENTVSAGAAGCVLATSREPLGVDGEAVVRVPSLDVSDDGGGSVGAAVELLMQRAQEAGWEPGEGDLAALRQICVRVDGVPLAIELAGAQLGFMSPAELDHRLETGFDLLVDRRRRRRDRHHTLHAVMDWSWQLLDDDERALLARLSVFPASFDLDAVEAVSPLAPRATVRALGGLVAKSLVDVARTGNTRYRLLETVRDYSSARLAAAHGVEAAALAHRDHFLAVAAAIPRDEAMQSIEAEAGYRQEWENFRTAIVWSIDHDQPAAAATVLGGGLSSFLGGVGAPEAIAIVELVLDSDREKLPPPALALATMAGVEMVRYLGDYRRFEKWAPQAVDHATTARDPALIAYARVMVGHPLVLRDRQRAVSILQLARAAAVESGSVLMLNLVDTVLASTHLLAGDPTTALRGCDEVLARDIRGMGWGLAAHYSAISAALLDDIITARQRVELYHGNPSVSVPAFHELAATDTEAAVEAIAGDLTAARRLAADIRRRATDMGDDIWRGELAVLLATIAAREHRPADAATLLDATFDIGMFQPLEYFLRRRVAEAVYPTPPADWDGWHGPRPVAPIDADCAIDTELAKYH